MSVKDQSDFGLVFSYSPDQSYCKDYPCEDIPIISELTLDYTDPATFNKRFEMLLEMDSMMHSVDETNEQKPQTVTDVLLQEMFETPTYQSFVDVSSPTSSSSCLPIKANQAKRKHHENMFNQVKLSVIACWRNIQALTKQQVAQHPNKPWILLYHLHSVWSVFLGYQTTLDWHTYNVLLAICSKLYEIVETAEKCIQNFEQLQMKPITLANVRLAYCIYTDLSTLTTECEYAVQSLNHLVQDICDTSTFNTSYYPPNHPKVLQNERVVNERLDVGFQWISEIVSIYEIASNHTYPVSANQMMNFFKDHHSKLNDEDFFTLIYHIEYVLGNTSLELITYNLEKFLAANWMSLPQPVRNVLNRPDITVCI